MGDRQGHGQRSIVEERLGSTVLRGDDLDAIELRHPGQAAQQPLGDESAETPFGTPLGQLQLLFGEALPWPEPGVALRYVGNERERPLDRTHRDCSRAIPRSMASIK